MKNFFKTYWKTLLFFALIGFVGGFFVGLYLMDSYPIEIQQQLLEQGIDETLLAVISAIQSVGYGVVLGALGILLAKKVGLWKEERILTKKPLIISIFISIVGGLALILPDIFFFGKYSEVIMNLYAVKPTIPYMIAMVTYGAVIEEVMLRLFMMSLVAFILHKLFDKNNETTSTSILVLANIIAAILFAAEHLPTTFIMIGNSPMIIFRCFLLNGVFGLLFGWLYRKYGLRYAMIAHGGCHIVSKLIWILFI